MASLGFLSLWCKAGISTTIIAALVVTVTLGIVVTLTLAVMGLAAGLGASPRLVN